MTTLHLNQSAVYNKKAMQTVLLLWLLTSGQILRIDVANTYSK